METIDDRRIDTLLAERRRRGIEARMMSDAEARFGPWFRRRQRRNLIARAIIGVAATAALVVIVALPQPDGLYISNPGYRTQALYSIDQTLTHNIL